MPRWNIAPPVRQDRGYKTPCLIWQGRPNAKGYGRKNVNGRTRPAHVVLWEEANGPVPSGHEIDHLCYQRMCVELSHLECVTSAENRRRASLRMTYETRSAAAQVAWQTRRVNGTTGFKQELRERIRARLAAGENYRQIREAERCSYRVIAEVACG